MGKRSKSSSTAREPGLVVESKRVKNKKVESECSVTNNESKPEETIMTTEDDKQAKKKNKTQSTESDANNETKPEETVMTSEDNKQAKRKRKDKTPESTESDANNESKPEETIMTSEDNKQAKRKRKNKTQSTETGNVKKNKKIIFNDDDDEPVEVDNTPIQRKRTNQQESPLENEEDIKDEDIDRFCDELDEEDNELYDNWVKLIEAKLNPNIKRPK